MERVWVEKNKERYAGGMLGEDMATGAGGGGSLVSSVLLQNVNIWELGVTVMGE